MPRTHRPDRKTAMVTAGQACEAWLRHAERMRHRGDPLGADFAKAQAANWSRIAFTRAAQP